jgi:hypothetical protein
MQQNLNLGPLSITFHRTVRVSEKELSLLPPSLGFFDIYQVSDYRITCPKSWEKNSYFIALHEKEAMWLSFETSNPTALIVSAGGINALTGKEDLNKLEEGNYLVTPPQPWLDGWKNTDGSVYQFVTTKYEKGEGFSVAEQLIGEKSVHGGLLITIFEAKNPQELEIYCKPDETVYGFELCSFASSLRCCKMTDFECEELGVGKGGKITQKIYPDPYGLKVWKTIPTAHASIYLINSSQFSEITGLPMPGLPKSFEDYIGKWYGLKDENYNDIEGTTKFDKLKSVFSDEL